MKKGIKGYIKKQILLFASILVKSRSVKSLRRLASFLGLLVPKKDRKFFKNVHDSLEEGNPYCELYKRILVESNKNFRKKSVNNLLIQGAVLNQSKREAVFDSGSSCPTTVLISPSMRCNLRCKGCYAYKYPKKDDLDLKIIDRVIREGNEMGVAFYTILGGEPFIRKDLMDLYREHDDSFFLVFTNGTLIDDKTAKEIAGLGNVLPLISIEGNAECTDSRRGEGVYKKILQAMDNLNKYDVPFGYSVAVTSHNINSVTSDEFIDFLIKKRAVIGWYFLYMPVCDINNLSLMPTPEQRLHLKEKTRSIRNTKPLFTIDFWNDAPYVGGCIAGSRYIHINNKGDVEPCIFTHFSEVNIKDHSLKEIMDCDFFKKIRDRQPYSENLYRPCMLIDNPEVARELYNMCNIHPTHKEAEKFLYDVDKEIDEYAEGVKDIFDEVWKKEKTNNTTGHS